MFNFLKYFILHDTCCQSTLMTKFCNTQNDDTVEQWTHRQKSICHYFSGIDSIKPSLLFSKFGYYFSKGSLFRLFRDHSSCRCGVWWPNKVSLYIDTVFLFLHFPALWDCRVQYFICEQSCAQPWARRHEGCRPCHYLS